MYISKVSLNGFRNFKNATINFTEKSLIIGSNEIGKTNLLYALRLLLDRNLAEASLEPGDSDFYAHEDTNDIEILIEFKEVCDDCVLSKLRERISDDGTLYLSYQATRDPTSRRKDYKILAGHSRSALTEIEGRFYLRVLNLKFMGSNRDLSAYIRRERKQLLQEAKENRSDKEIAQDSNTLNNIGDSLRKVDEDLTKLTYVNEATEGLNAELKNLSIQNANQEVVFDSGASLCARIDETTLLKSLE